jgi:signal recognition particle GTPase
MRDGSVRSSFRTTALAHFATEKFAKKLLGDNDVQTVLRRLDRLTQEESRATAVQTLEIIHGLVNNMTVVMEGAAHSLML